MMTALGDSARYAVRVTVMPFKDEDTPMKTPLRFLLIEDQPFYADGFRAAIKRRIPGSHIVQVASGGEARSALKSCRFDLVFVDIQLRSGSVFALLDEFQRSQPQLSVVVLLERLDALLLERVRNSFARGALLKNCTEDEIDTICRRITDNAATLDLPRPAPMADVEMLTAREVDVLEKLVEGIDNSQICQACGISGSTLRTHLRRMFRKLEVTNRTACVVKAMRLGWV
ncbi:response regulator transcription factor [Allohahella marinimesophila]|uniref:Response regulator transcription factor n=1 Tax=Allohahella marinimesophila TaxID=1054972 RepID=A0ABP7P7X9_9GAMM